MQIPAAGKESPQAPVHAGGQPTVQQLCRNGPLGPAGQQADHEIAKHPQGKVANSILHQAAAC